VRETCYNCARKHIAQAEVLSAESLLGYPEHKWLAVGHLAEAEAELLEQSPYLAVMIRENRLLYTEDDTPFPTMETLGEITKAEVKNLSSDDLQSAD